MAATRVGVLGVRWLQRAARSVMPLGARTASHITKDMLPGPYPKTPEERAAAAKKYNMRVEDYEPYPDDGMGYGDYPKLPDHSQQERDPWYDWDHSDLRLNWGEPLHWNLDMFIRNRVDTSPTPVSWDVMCKHLFGFVAFMIFMFWLGDTYPTYQPVDRHHCSSNLGFLFALG
uniref:NADH:ubiquinone oxidoreductase subunit B8 n=1 Tax=Oryctolagus cuniculus TaxID=9986 RepID=A0A5F9CGZ0_RABIT